MTDYTVTLLESIGRFAEEVSVTGLREDALKRAVQQFNEVRQSIAQQEPDNSVWNQIPELDAAHVSASELSLFCDQLLRVARHQEQEEEGVNVWHITRPTKLSGSFKGLVFVHPGVDFSLHGSVKGTLVLLGDARLLWHGSVKGTVEQSEESDIVYHGAIKADIKTVVNLEEKYRSYLSPVEEG
ncbi:hypothetical protein [Alicyclobacillus fodiniaquatilis]|uniref:Cell wall-active antibiotic response 4TMS protein YvqF n=1 Tax=Alicyclobacillus fodiniaquatilis TaxID=1661150 RepID=A0ABW4JNE3_9BACL